MARIIVSFLILFSITTTIHAQTHHPQVFLEKIKGVPDEGKQIVAHFCSSCHALEPMIPIGAPRMGVLGDWSPRVKQELKLILQHTLEGINMMPPRGGCFECTDKQLILALIYMLPEQTEKELKDELLGLLKDK